MAVRAGLRVEGIREARAMIGAVGDRARRPEPPLRSVATHRDLYASEQRLFRMNGGGRWRRPSGAWVAEKRRRGLDTRTLRATGNLEGFVTSSAAMTFRAFNGTLSWGIPRGRSDVYYAHTLARDRRGRRGWRMVVIDTDARNRISIRVERYIADDVIA